MLAFRSVVPVVAIAEPSLSRCADSIPPMSDGFDLGQEVAASLGSRQGAWRFIRRFAESWLTPLTDEDGWTEDDLRAAERHLGLRLPPAIREAYALFGRRQDLTSVKDRLLDPDQLEVDVTGEVLIYRVENQSVAVWEYRWPPWSNLIHRWWWPATSRTSAGSRFWSGSRWAAWRWCCRSPCSRPRWS